MMKLWFIPAFLLGVGLVSAQVPTDGLVTYISMDALDIVDESEIGNDLEYANIDKLGCGTSGSAGYFDGTSKIEFMGDYNTYFRGNFTLSFDFKPTGGAGKQILFSKSANCLAAQDFEISYVASSNSLGFVMSESFDRRLDFTITLNPYECWYHVDVVRAGPETYIYVNGERVAESKLDIRIDFTNPGFLSVSESPCIPDRASSFVGYIDEIRIYNRPLKESELYELYDQMNKILTLNDTLTYVGMEVSVRVTDDCTDSYSWSPSLNVENPSAGNTRISTPDPGEFLYTLTFDEESCQAIDTLRIRVVDPGNVNCESLIMPSAFTPNEDGLNDYFKISNPFIIEELKRFQIFDRGGGLVFETSNADEGWDGKYKDDYVAAGTYLYRIIHVCNGEEKILQGNVIVLR